MAESGTTNRWLHGLALTALVAIGLLAACGDVDQPAAGVPDSSETSAVTSIPTLMVEPTLAPATNATTLLGSVTEEVAAELAAQRATWQEEGPDSYEFTMRIEVFGPWYGEYEVVVVDDEPVSIVRVDESVPAIMPDLPGTIDAVFDVLEGMVTADSFTATYHDGLGYPMSAVIDNYLNAVDDEFAVFVTSLTPTAG
jgi:hypothetical protein